MRKMTDVGLIRGDLGVDVDAHLEHDCPALDAVTHHLRLRERLSVLSESERARERERASERARARERERDRASERESASACERERQSERAREKRLDWTSDGERNRMNTVLTERTQPETCKINLETRGLGKDGNLEWCDRHAGRESALSPLDSPVVPCK
jgi:hypothetical protein